MPGRRRCWRRWRGRRYDRSPALVESSKMPPGYIQFLLKTHLVLCGAGDLARRYKAKAPFHISDLLLDFTLALLQPSRFAYHFFFLFLPYASECITAKFRED